MNRRRFLQTGVGTALVGLMAGCSSPGEASEMGTTTDETESTTRAESESYSVSMPPVGAVTFEEVPERAAVY
ncbi:MAG: hypothetical protein ACOCP3_02820 [Halodesulfurarchaeum sp.]